ncbi:phosphate ABC transporter permease PstA [Candidatus Caldatribacterium sp. SIUC1]|uniref:phosphate ABC transporter permease PstA n=1 Tax=Candidatus Caldatribacterium sp. SIUC1 TaxID=3418365 RepID=UPI003F690D36
MKSTLSTDILLAWKRQKEKVFLVLAALALLFSLIVLFTLIIDAFLDGLPRLNLKFLTSFPSRKPEEAGVLPAMVGSVYVTVLTVLFAIPLGVGSAVYLEVYAPKNRLSAAIEASIATLGGVPSIIYGMLGLELFARALQLGRSLLTGALTLALLVLPIVIVSTRESLRAVPQSLWEAALALGATRWQALKDQILPVAFPGILTGIILTVSRAIGEAAPLIMIGALTYVAFLPRSVLSPFTTLPIQIFNWVSRPQKAFHANAAAGIIVLLAITLSLNALSITLRNRLEKRMPRTL